MTRDPAAWPLVLLVKQLREWTAGETHRENARGIARTELTLLSGQAYEMGDEVLEERLLTLRESDDPVEALAGVLTIFPELVERRDDAVRSEFGESTAASRRQAIPERVRHEVWRRDQAQCVDCGSRVRLEFDHIIPVARGGSNTARNIELRCEACNRTKGARI